MAGVYGSNPFAPAGEDFNQQHKSALTAAKSDRAPRPPPAATPKPAPPVAAGSAAPGAAAAAASAAAAAGGATIWAKPGSKKAIEGGSLGGNVGRRLDQTTGGTAKPSWAKDSDYPSCASCHTRFDMHVRRHHCRGCGIIFCDKCTPPPKMMLPVAWGIKEPQRCCVSCAEQLKGLQAHLVATNSNSNRGNEIDTGGMRRYFNRPLSFTLGGEVRKAAHTLNNMMSGLEAKLLDDPTVQANLMRGAKALLFLTVGKVAFGAGLRVGTGLVVVRLKKPGLIGAASSGSAVKPTAGRIAVTGGGGGSNGGSNGGWSAPCAVGLVGVSIGLEAGLETSDMVLPINDQGTLEAFALGTRHMSIGGEASLSFGLIGRTFARTSLATTTPADGDAAASSSSGPDGGAATAAAPLGAAGGGAGSAKDEKKVNVGKTSNAAYSHSRGVYGGVAIQGGMVVVRNDVNTKFYGKEVMIGMDSGDAAAAPAAPAAPAAADPAPAAADPAASWCR